MKKLVKNISFLVIIGVLSGGCKYSGKIETNNRQNNTEQLDTVKYKYALIEGEKQFILGNYNAASELMKECLNIKSSSSVPYYNLAKIEFRKGNLIEAKSYINSAIERDHLNRWYFKLLTQIQIGNNDIIGAINSTKELMQLEPNELSNYLYLADLYISKKDYKAVLRVYDDIDRVSGYNPKFRLEKIKLLDIIGENTKAKEELINLIKIYPDNAYYYGLLAEFYVEDIEYEKALGAYDKVRELEPDNGILHLSMFEFYTRIGEKDKALEEIENAIKHKDVPIDNKIQALVGLNEIYRSKEVENLQKKLIDYLCETNPDDYRVALLKVEKLMKDKQYRDASETLERVVNSNKNNFYIWQQLMIVENIRNDNNSLKLKSEEALSIFPNQPIFYMFNGIANYNLKKYDAAVSILKAGIDFSNNNNEIRKQIFTYIGESYYRKENLDEAFSYFDKALELDSNNTYVLNNYSYYLALENKQLSKADILMRKCINLDSENASYLDTYAWVLFQKEDYKEALKYIEKAYNNGGDSSVVILEHYGDILFKNGYKNQALEKWKNAMDKGSKSEELKEKIEKGKLTNDN